MREIKFRAWDKTNKKWLNVGKHFDVDNGSEINPGSGSQFYPTESLNGIDFELMQYTGLKDKNGKEIYEGDICKYIHSSIKDLTKTIEWKDYRWNIMSGINWEIIGNIYENEELLK